MKNAETPMFRKRQSAYIAALAFFMLLGLIAWIVELAQGLGVTGMRNVISWGFYIFTFAFFVKLSAGGLIVASAAEVFGIKALKPLARLGVLTAVVSVFLAAITIIPDLGRPARIANLFLHPNFRSPMIWDITIIALYLVLAGWELRLLSQPPSEQRKRTLKILAIIALPAAFALHSITAWIFGLQISRPFWNSAIMAPLFVVSAILCGTALITVIAAVLQHRGVLILEPATWNSLRVLIVTTLAIDLFFTFCEYITVLWGGVPRDVVALKMILPGGQHSALFWLEWLFGGAMPLVLLVSPRTRQHVRSIVSSAGLCLIGVYAFQIQLTTVGMANPLVQLPPGNSLGTYAPDSSAFQLVGQYSPTWVEYAIGLGLLAFGAALISAGVRYLGVSDAAPVTSRSQLEKAVGA